MSEGLVQRKRWTKDEHLGGSQPNIGTGSDEECFKEIDDGDSKETRLTLMEEVLLLGRVHLLLERLHFKWPERLHPRRAGY